MIAEVARYLHQSINEVEDWEDDRFLAYHGEIPRILENEQPRKD